MNNNNNINTTPIDGFSSVDNSKVVPCIDHFKFLVQESNAGYDCPPDIDFDEAIKNVGDSLDNIGESFDFLGLYATTKTVFQVVNNSVVKTVTDLSECVNNATEGLKNASEAFPQAGDDIAELIKHASNNVLNVATDLMDTVEQVVLDADEMLRDSSKLVKDMTKFLNDIPSQMIDGNKSKKNLIIFVISVLCLLAGIMILLHCYKKGVKNG